MMKLAELGVYFSSDSVFACASANLICFTLFHFAVPPRFPPSLSLTLLPFQLFQRRGRRRTSSLPSPPPRPMSSPREPCRLWSRTTATTSHRARRRGKTRRRGMPPTCSPEDSGLRYVPTAMSSNKRLTRYHPLSICLRGSRTAERRRERSLQRGGGQSILILGTDRSNTCG